MDSGYICRMVCLVGINISVLTAAGCKPRDGTMLVADVQGDMYAPDLKARAWAFQETKRCELVKLANSRSDKREDLLICGEKTRLAWSMSSIKSDLGVQIYNASRRENVVFTSGGSRKGPAGDLGPPSWLCKKTASGISCE